jgi:hypothetical protein
MQNRGKKNQTFADRFLQLKGDESFQSLADKLAKTGVRVSPQALHKYANGGEISHKMLLDVARFFDVSPAWLYFGVEEPPADALPADLEVLTKALTVIPERFRHGIERDIYKIALAYTDKDAHRAMYQKFERALQELDKR